MSHDDRNQQKMYAYAEFHGRVSMIAHLTANKAYRTRADVVRELKNALGQLDAARAELEQL